MSDNTARVSPTDLLHAVEQLPPAELDEFVRNIISFQAHRRAKSLPAYETDLLQRINQPLSASLLARYRELIALRQEERLTEAEYAEIVQIGDAVGQFNSERLTSLAELAKLRKISLTQIMDDLGIHPLEI